MQASYVVITPVRDEALHIERTIHSMMSQSALPTEWIIVDDGSTDGTCEIIERYASLPWLRIVRRANRGRRSSGGGVVEAFNAGYAALQTRSWELLVKLDGDLSFSPDYFESCMREFQEDPRLGIGGGTVLTCDEHGSRIDSVGDPPFHVRGATKMYRHACWQVIGQLARAPGWDTIDEVKANYLGWTTRTFATAAVVQHKPTGSADGHWKNWLKNGLANYMTGYHPLFMIAKCVRRATRRPFLVESTALAIGFCSGYLRRISPAVDVETKRFLRRQQLRRLTRRPSIYGP